MYWKEMSYWRARMTWWQRFETMPEEISEYDEARFRRDIMLDYIDDDYDGQEEMM